MFVCADVDAVNRLRTMTADKILNADIRSHSDGKRYVILWDKNLNINSLIAGTVVEFQQDEAVSVEGIEILY